jgi:AcrR family transcriptional regulator
LERRGRPPSPATRQAILEAAAALVREDGYRQTSVAAIAKRAHASNKTVYRIWGSKARLVADAVLTGALPFPVVAVPDTGDLRADLVAWLDESLVVGNEPNTLSIVRALVAEQSMTAGEGNAVTGPAFGPILRALHERLETGRRRGEIRPEADADAAIALLVGAQTMGFLDSVEFDKDRARAWVDVIAGGIEPRAVASPPPPPA